MLQPGIKRKSFMKNFLFPIQLMKKLKNGLNSQLIFVKMKKKEHNGYCKLFIRGT